MITQLRQCFWICSERFCKPFLINFTAVGEGASHDVICYAMPCKAEYVCHDGTDQSA